MPGRNTSTGESYRYAYNGMEQDNEVSGNGNSYTTEFRQYDPRLGRWKSVDPLAAQAAGWNPYRFGFDNPIIYTDELGLFEKDKAERKAERINKSNDRKATVVYGGEERGYGVFVSRYDGENGLHYATYYKSGKPINEHGDAGVTTCDLEGYSSWSIHFIEENNETIGFKFSLRKDYDNGDKIVFRTTTIFEGDFTIMTMDGSHTIGGAGALEYIGGPATKGVKWALKGLAKLFTRSAAKAAVKKIVVDKKVVAESLKEHAFSIKHMKNGVMDLGKNQQDIIKQATNTIKNNKSVLNEGDNIITTTMNGHKAVIKAHVKNGTVTSANVYKGVSKPRKGGTANWIEL